MPHKHNVDRRHHIPKMAFKVQNWPAYEAGLRGVVARIDGADASIPPYPSSGKTDGSRASQLRHSVQDTNGDTNFCATAFVLVESQAIADYLFIATDCGLH